MSLHLLGKLYPKFIPGNNVNYSHILDLQLWWTMHHHYIFLRSNVIKEIYKGYIHITLLMVEMTHSAIITIARSLSTQLIFGRIRWHWLRWRGFILRFSFYRFIWNYMGYGSIWKKIGYGYRASSWCTPMFSNSKNPSSLTIMGL